MSPFVAWVGSLRTSSHNLLFSILTLCLVCLSVSFMLTISSVLTHLLSFFISPPACFFPPLPLLPLLLIPLAFYLVSCVLLNALLFHNSSCIIYLIPSVSPSIGLLLLILSSFPSSHPSLPSSSHTHFIFFTYLPHCSFLLSFFPFLPRVLPAG